MQLENLLWLFPVVFMIHEFEEIIFLKPWWRHNKRSKLSSPFAHSAKQPLEIFVAIVAEEFVLFSAIIAFSIGSDELLVAAGLVCAVGLHLVGHIVEAIRFRRYMPSVVSAVITLPYYVYTAHVAMHAGYSAVSLTLATTLIGIFGLANLLLMHKIGDRFS